MARARALVLFLAAGRAISGHADAYGPPPTSWAFVAHDAGSGAPAARAFSAYAAAASGAPATASRVSAHATAASRALSTYAAASSGAATASRVSAHATAASGAPAAASKALPSSAVAPVGAGSAGGRGPPFWRLGYGALATIASAAIMLCSAPIPEWDLVDDDADDHWDEEHGYDDLPGGLYVCKPFRLPSAREVRANTEMLRIVNARMKKLMKSQKEQQQDNMWTYLEELVKKGKLILSTVSVLNDARALFASAITGSAILIEKYGDRRHYFICPFSGYSELVHVIIATPNAESQQGDGTGHSSALQKSTSSSGANVVQEVAPSPAHRMLRCFHPLGSVTFIDVIDGTSVSDNARSLDLHADGIAALQKLLQDTDRIGNHLSMGRVCVYCADSISGLPRVFEDTDRTGFAANNLSMRKVISMLGKVSFG